MVLGASGLRAAKGRRSRPFRLRAHPSAHALVFRSSDVTPLEDHLLRFLVHWSEIKRFFSDRGRVLRQRHVTPLGRRAVVFVDTCGAYPPPFRLLYGDRTCSARTSTGITLRAVSREAMAASTQVSSRHRQARKRALSRGDVDAPSACVPTGDTKRAPDATIGKG